MGFDEFIGKVEEHLKNNWEISFALSNWTNGSSFGIIKKSNLEGVFIVGEEHYIGDGDTAMSKITLCKNVLEAFDYIWKINSWFTRDLKPYKDCIFIFNRVEGLTTRDCYHVL